MKTYQAEFKVSEADAGRMELSSAVLLYSGRSEAGTRTFATVHGVHTNDQGQASLLAGKPLTERALAQIVRSLRQPEKGGFVPANLIYHDPQRVAWWVAPKHRAVWFRCAGGELGALERSEVVPHPGLVFTVSTDRRWSIVAVKGAERPTELTPVFRAPYFNVWTDRGGEICTGNVALPAASQEERFSAWGDAFFNSWFTHPNSQKLVKYRGGAYAFWKAMLDGRHAEFPEKVLLPTEQTLAEWLGRARTG